MKNKKILTIGICILFVIIIVIGIFVINHNKKMDSLENKLVEITTKYYDEQYVPFFPDKLKDLGKIQIDAYSLKQLKYDVSEFEKNKCDLKNTYVTFIYEKDTKYDVKVHLDCK